MEDEILTKKEIEEIRRMLRERVVAIVTEEDDETGNIILDVVFE